MGNSYHWAIYFVLSAFCYRYVSNNNQNEQLRQLRVSRHITHNNKALPLLWTRFQFQCLKVKLKFVNIDGIPVKQSTLKTSNAIGDKNSRCSLFQ